MPHVPETRKFLIARQDIEIAISVDVRKYRGVRPVCRRSEIRRDKFAVAIV